MSQPGRTTSLSASQTSTAPEPDSGGSLTALGMVLLLPLPWLLIRASGLDVAPVVVAVLSGVAILGAAFLLSWAAELLQIDVSQALALAVLALIAVLPEYAVDAVFAYQAGRDPVVAQQGYAVANMTGGNRLLIGVGWSAVVLLAWWRHGAHTVQLHRGQALEVAVLLVATLYALVIPLNGELGLINTVVLLGLFAGYTWATTRAPTEEPDLVGPSARIGRLRVPVRRSITAGLFLFAGLAIFLSAEPFAESLIETGRSLSIDEFLLVQWLAPLASEAPEFVVALLFVWRAKAAAGISTLVSSKVNQWTLLIATLPLVYSFGAGRIEGMPLVTRQQHELWLTAAQSLFAILLIVDGSIRHWEAAALLVPFVAQLVLPASLGPIDLRLAFIFAYLLGATALLFDPRRRRALRALRRVVRDVLNGSTEPAVKPRD
jgi:cation:H+ antiporter